MFIREVLSPTTDLEPLQAKSVIRPTDQTLRANKEQAVLMRLTSAQVTETLRHIQQAYYLECRTFLQKFLILVNCFCLRADVNGAAQSELMQSWKTACRLDGPKTSNLTKLDWQTHT